MSTIAATQATAAEPLLSTQSTADLIAKLQARLAQLPNAQGSPVTFPMSATLGIAGSS